MIPFIDLRPLTDRISPGALARIAQATARCEFVEGPAVDELERALARELGLPHAVACASGTSALVIALRAVGVRPGMKVAVPDLTFWATYEAVVQIGAIPVLVDVDPDDLQMSLAGLLAAHERFRVDAAILVHLFGWASAQLAAIRRVCTERGILLVEDAAQAYGTRVAGEHVVRGALAAALSFYPAKVLGGAMDGGAILFAHAEHAEVARSLKNHGRAAHYTHVHSGYSSRMASFQAAWLLEALPLADEIVRARRELLGRYRELLAPQRGVRVLGAPPGIDENGYLCVLTTAASGDEVVLRLREAGIAAARTYPAPLHAQRPAHEALRAQDLTVSEEFCRRVFNPPVFFGMRDDQWQAIARVLPSMGR